MIFRPLPIGVIFCLFSFSLLSAQEAPFFGKGIFNLVGQDSSWQMKVGLRFQTLGEVTWPQADDGALSDAQTDMLIRRARLKFDGFALTPRLQYKVELGLSNRDLSGASPYTGDAARFLLDAVVMWNFYENLVLWAGQTKLPGNIERVISSGDLQQVDRSLLNRRFNLDRDMGLQLRHHFYLGDRFLVREKVAFSQGEGRNITAGNLGGHQYTARLEFLPMGPFEDEGEYSGADLEREQSPKLMIAATLDTNQDAVRTRGNLGSFMETDEGLYQTDIQTFFLDAMFKYRGYSFMAEYANRDADNPVASHADGTPTGDVVLTGEGLNLQSGYLFHNDWEVSGRFTHNTYTSQGELPPSETQYTLGVSRYIVGHKLKIQTDISYLEGEGTGADELMYRLQFDIHF